MAHSQFIIAASIPMPASMMTMMIMMVMPSPIADGRVGAGACHIGE